jgi:soluble lytic murein transglycosylase-like protein
MTQLRGATALIACAVLALLPATEALAKTKAKAKAKPKLSAAQVAAAKTAQARQAYYSGDARKALTLALAAGERWIAGLAAYRLERFEVAQSQFAALADAPTTDAWLRSASAFWAGRSAEQAAQGASSDKSFDFLQVAAQYPHTFYGMIAERKLALAGAAMGHPAAAERDLIGELLADSTVRPIDARAYPLPELAPKGGFTLDPALVYALVRQESAFNPLAVSGAGAVGLMQLMPEAAARAAGDDKLKADMSPLFDPAMNLRVGQDYFTWLIERGLNDFDLLRAVAAYNGGAGSLLRAAELLGPDPDTLLLIESLPAQETRNYVEKVVAGYWTYRKLFGAPTHTLDALASGSRTVDIRLDARAVGPVLASAAGV